MCVVGGPVLSGARTSYMGIVIGWIWGGEACGQIPTHWQSKQILGGGAGMVGVGLFYSWKRPSVTQEGGILPERLPADLAFSSFRLCCMFTLDINITEHAHGWKFCSLLWWLHMDIVMLCSISFSRLGEPPTSYGWEWGGILGKSPSFYCSKSLVKHLNFHLS